MSHHTFASLFRFTLVFALATGAMRAEADLFGPRGVVIEPEQDFVDVGHFGYLFPGELDDDPTLTGARNLRALDDGFGQLETRAEVMSPVSFANPGTPGAGAMGGFDDGPEPFEVFNFIEIPFANPPDTDGGPPVPSIPQIVEGTSVRMTTTLPLVSSDPFNIWVIDLDFDEVWYPVEELESFDLNTITLLNDPNTFSVTFGGSAVTNLGSQLQNDGQTLLLFFDPVSGSGTFEVTFFIESLVDVPTIGEGGSVPGGYAYHNFVQNAATGVTDPGIWVVDAVGLWTDGGNWGPGGVPTTASAFPAIFGDVITADRTVAIIGEQPTSGIEFDSPFRFVLGGPGTVSLQSDSSSSTVTVTQGSHEFQAKVALANNTTVATSAATQLDFNNSLDLGGNTLTITGPGLVNINNSAEVFMLEADFDGNGVVNSVDLGIWETNYGATGASKADGDADGDGVVSGFDFLVIQQQLGSVASGNGDISNQGNLGGSGRISGDLANELGGILGPGNSAGTLLVDGDFTQDPNSTLAIELGGLLAGEFDLLDIGGTATLDGDLAISLINSFMPNPNDTFDVLTATSITDNSLTLTGESGFSFSIVAGGNGQVLRLELTGLGAIGGSAPHSVPEPGSFMLSLFAISASLGFRRRRAPANIETPAEDIRRVMLPSSMLATAVALMIFIFCSRDVMAQPTLVTFDLGLDPNSISFDVLGDQLGIAVAGVPGGTINVVNFPPLGGGDLFRFTPSIDGEEDLVWDHTGGKGAVGDFTYVIAEGLTALLFENPSNPTFGITGGVEVASIWIGRTFFSAVDGEIIGLKNGVEKWRMPVLAGVVDFDFVGGEVSYVEIFPPQGIPERVDELQFDGIIPIFDDITIGKSGLPAPPSEASWIGGSFGLMSEVGAWSTFDPPSTTLGVVVDSVDSSRLLITDGGFTTKSLTIDGGESVFTGTGAVTLDSSTNDPTLDLLSGSADFQAPFTLADPLTIDVDPNSSLVFNNVVDLAGNILTITGGGTVTFNNRILLGGGSIVGPLVLGPNAVVVPEPMSIALLGLGVCLGAVRRRPRSVAACRVVVS